MAVSVEQGVARELRKLGVGNEILLQELAEQERLLAQGLCAFIVGEEVDQFVAEYGNTTGLKAHYGDSSRDLGLELVEDFEKKTFGAVEHAEIVERASAAEIGTGDSNAKTRCFEDFNSGFGGGGKEIVVEGVGPEEDLGG